MAVIFSGRKDCYCAFCRSERAVYTKKNIGVGDIFGSALGAGVLMMAIWQEFDPRSLVIFVFLLAIAEVFVQVRWRMTIACPHCGFDPVLYLKDQGKAVEKVKIRLDQRRNNPATLLAKPLHLPKLTKQQAENIQKAESGQKGSLVSRQI